VISRSKVHLRINAARSRRPQRIGIIVRHSAHNVSPRVPLLNAAHPPLVGRFEGIRRNEATKQRKRERSVIGTPAPLCFFASLRRMLLCDKTLLLRNVSPRATAPP
jgi:hypothetical protein